MSRILMLTSTLLMISKALSFYNKSYDGYTFILPDIETNRSSSKPMKLSFTNAQSWCEKNIAGSTLATIHNRDVQRDVTLFMGSALQDNNWQLVVNLSSNIRLNGKYHMTDDWRWVNGHPKADLTVHNTTDEGFPFYARIKNLSIYSTTANKTGRFICEYPDNSEQCEHSRALLNERCYKTRSTSSTWYDARNNCSGGGGDLASFETLSDTKNNDLLRKLYLDSNAYYWIGLQKNEWLWKDTGTIIKYTSWEINHPSNYSLRCLCLTRPHWNWKECGCLKPYPFICLLNDTINSSTPLNDNIISATNNFDIIIACCSAVIFIAVIIIVAVLIATKRRNSNAPRSVGVRSSAYENPEYSVTDATKDFPVYSEIQKPNRETSVASNATYAKVEMAANTNEEYPVNGIVYAELDLAPRA